ncbi:MAG: glycoside hydrolase family 9 protein, partial [Bacteroidota bacterium]
GRRAAAGTVVWTGSPHAWNSGQLHSPSGDEGWWLDFSSVSVEGNYYLYDPLNDVRSHQFRIAANVYVDLLQQAIRTFYYQRLNLAKTATYAGPLWTEGLAFAQDEFARSRWDKNNPTTERNLLGGWMDAGDVNKYTTFTETVIHQLLLAYRLNPQVFTDNYNIPESGNGIPDLIDEVLWELDWLKKMQDATGTDGFLLKVGVDNYDYYHPPSTDPRPRYYLPECTSATLSGTSMFAFAGVVLQATNHTSLQNYGADLIQRARDGWARAVVTTNNFTNFEENCDDGDIKAGDADQPVATQMEAALRAAIYLYEATGEAQYRNFVESQYVNVRPYSENWWGPYYAVTGHAMLRYTELPNVSPTVANNIIGQKTSMNYLYSIDDYNNELDLYRAHMENSAHHWGSNQVRANCGNLNFDFIDFNLNPSSDDLYRDVGASYLNWLHGTNPLGQVMLSNMYDHGAEYSIDEIYHTWFDDGTIYDNAQTSSNGPAPAYLVGGPNASYSQSITPPANQPPQKSYKDWNTGWPEASWEISEPAIYYQAAYVLLLSRVIGSTSLPLAVEQSSFYAIPQARRIELYWSNETETNSDFFVLERSADGKNFQPLTRIQGAGTTDVAQHYRYTDRAPLDGVNYYRLAQYDFSGARQYSRIISVDFRLVQALKVFPNPVDGQSIQVDFQGTEAQAIELAVIDSRGQVLLREQRASHAGPNRLGIVVADLPTGIYTLRLREGAEIWTERFVKQ